MLDKIEPYDFVSIVVPGLLLAYWFPICYPQLVTMVAAAKLPASIDLIGFVVVGIFVGQLVQALASFLEPLLFLTFGGRPSDTALWKGLGNRYLPADNSHRIRNVLLQQVGKDASDHSLFVEAITLANDAENPRVERFNSLFAYHRGLLVVVLAGFILLLTSRLWGAAAVWPGAEFAAWLVGLFLTFVLLWYRTKQRAYYYVREVLKTAEKSLRKG